MTLGPTLEHVATQVAIIRRQRPDARAIGIAISGLWLGGATLQVNGDALPVVFCASALQVSEALASQADDGPPLLILTNLDEGQLSLDVLARLAGRRLHPIDRWQMVRDLFRARQIDPRLAPQGWIADALLQQIPEGGYPPVASGLLDADTAWSHILQQQLGLSSGRPDATALLQWSLCEQHLRRYAAWPQEGREAWRARVENSTGALGVALLDVIEAGYGALLLPIGLVCEILFAVDGRQHMGIAQARARLEPYIGGRMLTSEVGDAWSAAAIAVLAALPDATARDWLDRTERLLTDLKAADHSYLSTVLLSGFHQRLSRFAEDLQDFLQGTAPLERLEASFADVCRHREAHRQTERLGRVEMALRLARYLAMGHTEGGPASFVEVGMAYVEQGAYVDWARRSLMGGDETGALAAAFRSLAAHVRQVRERQNQRFADLLGVWNKAPTVSDEVLPIEQALSRIVAKLARARPLLLLIIDGMSHAVFRELSDDLADHGWLALTDRPGRAMPSLVSMIPSVTEMSRASLLAGKPACGHSSTEKQNFASHGELLAASRASFPPVLFHKGELTEASATDLSQVVREAIRNPQQKVVAVVLNTVDDHLAKSAQLRLSWRLTQFQHLDALLYEAQLAHRVVVMTSDHGHVLDEGASRHTAGEEERWRAVAGDPMEGEAIFEGPRVERVTGVTRIIVPWSEALHYGPKKHGYHGGATPQEVLVPIGILTKFGDTVDGWEPLVEAKPHWWSSAEPPPSSIPTVLRPRVQRRRQAVMEQGSLFAGTEVGGVDEPHADWIGHLLASPIFSAQRRMAGRRAPDDRMVEGFLRLLDQHHDRLSQRALAQGLGQPDFRMRGILVGLQRVLNVEGYQVIAVDDATGTIEMNRQLLATQFQLSSWPP
jgi:hypothetical protein